MIERLSQDGSDKGHGEGGVGNLAVGGFGSGAGKEGIGRMLDAKFEEEKWARIMVVQGEAVKGQRI
jgi:hypothetical protein